MRALARAWKVKLGRLDPTAPQRDSLEVRLATSAHEIDAAQALRYRVFYEEMSARPSIEAAAQRRDRDIFDSHCDHLLIIDHAAGGPRGRGAGTYRLLGPAAAARTANL